MGAARFYGVGDRKMRRVVYVLVVLASLGMVSQVAAQMEQNQQRSMMNQSFQLDGECTFEPPVNQTGKLMSCDFYTGERMNQSDMRAWHERFLDRLRNITGLQQGMRGGMGSR